MGTKKQRLGPIVVVVSILVCVSAAGWAQADKSDAISVKGTTFWCSPCMVLFPGDILELRIARQDVTAVQSVQVSPPEGVKVRKAKAEKEHWRVTLDADKNATPGEREVALLTSQGTIRQTIRIPEHRPTLLSLGVRSFEVSPPTAVFEVVVLDEADDLGPSPRIDAFLRCERWGSMIGPERKVATQPQSVAPVDGRSYFQSGNLTRSMSPDYYDTKKWQAFDALWKDPRSRVLHASVVFSGAIDRDVYVDFKGQYHSTSCRVGAVVFDQKGTPSKDVFSANVF